LKLEFRDIKASDVSSYLSHWDATEERTSDYSFPILWGWAPEYGYQISVDSDEGLFWVRQTKPKIYDMAPIGRWERDDWEELLRDRCGDECEFWLVPDGLLSIWQEQFGDRMETESDRGNWEYLYDIEDLASLSGNKYMKKRNRVNQFRRRYNYSYEPITPDVIPEVEEFQLAWCQANDCSENTGLVREERCIFRILENWCDVPHLRGGLIRVGEEIAAYTIGELAGETIMVHFEKASLEYGAAYQVINKEFLARMLEDHPELKIANREEDLNNPGLREAKMSYLPVGFVKKHRVSIKF
jgi:hypothetical protein